MAKDIPPFIGAHKVVPHLNQVVHRVNQLSNYGSDGRVTQTNGCLELQINRILERMPKVGSATGVGATLVAVTTAPVQGDIYYKVKKVISGVATGEEFWVFVLTDNLHLGQPVHDFAHVFTLDEMFYVNKISTGTESVYYTTQSLSYVGDDGQSTMTLLQSV